MNKTRTGGPIIGFMWPTDYLPRRRFTGDWRSVPIGPAMTTLRSVVARLALVLRCAGIVYIAGQVAIWHSFFAADPRRLAGPLAAIAWAAVVLTYLRRRWPAPLFACMDSAVYVALALGAQACVPPAIRDDALSWLVVVMSGQIMVPAWYAPGPVSVPLALASPAAYWAGTGTGSRTAAAAALLLVVGASVHSYGRRVLYRRFAAADAALDEADRDAGEQYVVLSRNIERREHERLLHDTVLNTLTALGRAGADDLPEVVSRCRQDVALIEDALAGHGDPDTAPANRDGDLAGGVRAVAAEMRARGLEVHVGISCHAPPAVPAPVTTAISSATREALSNVAAHAGTGEAWVEVSAVVPDGTPGGPARLQVTVRDRGTGFDPARVDRARLGLRRSIAERINDCGGHASIWSAPGRGTVIRMCWPAPGQEAPPAAQRSLPW
jgi:signal transduction histidine kinase